MTVVQIELATARAESTGAHWFEQAYGSASSLAGPLGHGTVSEFLPGLGDLTAWGLLGGHQVSGAVLTGFHANAESVSFMLSGLMIGDTLSSSSLGELMTLPATCLERFTVRSLVSGLRCIQVLDRGDVVLETCCAHTAELVVALTSRLVSDAVVELVESTAKLRPRFYARTTASGLVLATTARPGSSATGVEWQEIADWGPDPR